MKKYAFFAFLIMVGCHCNAPVSVKKADTEAQRLVVSFVDNNNRLFKRVVDFYRAREYSHIQYLADEALRKGATKEAVNEKVRSSRASVDVQYVKMLKKFLAIQKDLKQATALRAEISRFMESKVNYAELANVILKFGDSFVKTRVERRGAIDGF